MLDDRPYMRDPMYGSHRSYTIVLLITLAICFVIQSIVDFYSSFPVFGWFALTPASILKGWVWQFFTFQFLPVWLRA